MQYQIDDASVKHICDILVMVQSTYVRQFMILLEEIKSNIQEAKSNIDFLRVLEKPIAELKEQTHPKDIPSNLVKILQLIRYIWLKSPYYNTHERISLLCKALSNQIIAQCTHYLNLDIIFDEKKTRLGIKMLEEVIECMSQYIKAYVLVRHLSHVISGLICLCI